MIYQINNGTTECEGILYFTNPFIIIENENLVFGKQYKIDLRTETERVKIYHSGSSLNLTEIENHKVFVARGKILAIEFPDNETITFDQLNLVAV